MGSIAWKVVGADEKGNLVWGKRSVKFWDLLLYGKGTKSDFFEQWNSLILEQKHGIDFETEEVTRNLKNRKGYTLIELMIAIAIMSILAAVAIVAAKNAIAKARVATTRGNLGTLRATIMVYRTDHLGDHFELPMFPPAILASTSSVGGYGTGLSSALVPKYINTIPQAYSDSVHGYSNDVCEQWNLTGSCENVGTQYGSGWRYDANPWSETWGSITVACQHKNIYGVSWTTY